jgi:hypothetical protein
MAITDNLVLKVQPATGDTFIKNLVTVEDVAVSGAGAIALVDDAGLLGWHITGLRQGTFTGSVAYEANTITYAVRFKVNARAGDFLQYFALLSATSNGYGPSIGNNGTAAGALRIRQQNGGGGFTTVGDTATYTTGQYVTIICRFAEGGAGAGQLDVFLKQASRANNNPDISITGPINSVGTTGIINNLYFGAAGTDITIVDMAMWTRGVTNAEAAALADNIRTAINASPVAPGAPTIGTATAGVTSATVAFTAPASDGGSAITSYLATASTGETASNSASPISFPTLTAGVARTFHVQAVNAIGTGAASAESNSITPTAANAAPTFSGTIANITGTGGTAITTADVHALFSDTDALAYSASPGGTAWPAGLVINSSTGIISGTVATSTTTGLKVRATDTGSQTVDSNAFSVTISAPASTVTGVAVSPGTATVTGGSTQVFTATVSGTSSPSQSVAWTTSAGSISAGGVLTAPATISTVQTVTVTATSLQDGTKAGTATVTVPAATTVTFTPTRPLKYAVGGGLRLGVAVRATVLNESNDATVAIATGLTTSSTTGIPPSFSVAGPVSGTRYAIKITNIANPLDYALFSLVAA